MITAVMLLATSVAQYALDKDFPDRSGSAEQEKAGHALRVTPDTREMAAEKLPQLPLRSRKISQMIFRIN